MFITLFSLWLVRIPIAALLSGRILGTFSAWGLEIKLPPILSGQLQEVGIWWSVPLAWLVGSIFSFFYYRTGKWKTKTVVK
jgi:Na+-driven multidrug efflux pump